MDQIPDLKKTAYLHSLRKFQPASTVLKPVIPSGTTFTESLLKVNTKSRRENGFVESSSDETRVPTLTESKDTEQKAYKKPNSSVMKDITTIRGRKFYCYQEHQEKNTIFNLSCKYCDKKFASIWNLEDLEDHLQRLHTNHHLLCCRFCGKTFCTTGRLYEHVICNHKNGQIKNDQPLLGVRKKRSNQIAECKTQSKELTMHMRYLKRRILTKKSKLEIQLQNDIKSEIILEKSKLKTAIEQEVVVMGPPPSQLQQLKQAVELKRKRKRKSKSRAEIEIVGDGSNSQKHTDVNSDISHSKEQNSQVNYEEIVVKMEVDDSTMLQGQFVTLNGEKFIINQDDNVEGSYCLNKLDENVLNFPISNNKDESGTISKEPSECYQEQIFIKREIEDNDFSYVSGEKQSTNANIDDSQRISKCHGSEIFIKREIEDEDNNFAYITGEEHSNNSDIDNSQRISQCHGNEILIKKEIDDANLFFSPTNIEEQVNVNNIDGSQGIVECHGNDIIIKKEVEDEDFNIFSPSNREEQVNINNGDNSQGMVECYVNDNIIKKEVEDEDFNTFSHTNVDEQVRLNKIHDSQEMIECNGKEIVIKQEVEDEDYDFSYNTA